MNNNICSKRKFNPIFILFITIVCIYKGIKQTNGLCTVLYYDDDDRCDSIITIILYFLLPTT